MTRHPQKIYENRKKRGGGPSVWSLLGVLHVETHAVLGAVHEAHPGPAPAGLGDADDAGHPGVEIGALIRAVYAGVVERLSFYHIYHF